MKIMSTRLKVVYSYLMHLPGSDNISFNTGNMIDTSLGMIPKVWVENMMVSIVELRNLSINELVGYPENLENQDKSK